MSETSPERDPNFQNSPEDQEILEEMGHKELSDYSDEDLETLREETEQESFIANDVNQTRTPEEHRADVQKRLARISEEMKRRTS